MRKDHRWYWGMSIWAIVIHQARDNSTLNEMIGVGMEGSELMIGGKWMDI